MKFLFFGELMLRLTPSQPGVRLDMADTLRMTPGGSEANSAVALKSLGPHDVTFLSSFPENPLGKSCILKLRVLGVKVISIPSESQRMGLYWLDMGRGPRPSEIYYDRANSAFDLINPKGIAKDSVACDWFHSSGITPAISKRTCRSLFHIIEMLPDSIPFSLDLNFRNKLWKWADKERLKEVYDKLSHRAFLLSGNESDFQNCLGFQAEGNTADEIYSSITERVLLKYPQVNLLAVSLREPHSATRNTWSGMLFVRHENFYKQFTGSKVEIDSIVDRLGTGDSFTAGILHGLASFGNDYQKTLDFAVMLSALKHTVYGDFSLFTENEVLSAIQTYGTFNIKR